MTQHFDNEGLDIAGFGKLAKAIPPKVYDRTAAALVTTFQQLVAPLTASTAGLGRYLSQKFDNMVAAEKAIATYTVEKAVRRAKARAELAGRHLVPPSHPKSFVRAIEEASKETDPLLHEMWVNLLASQVIGDSMSHPHFVETLPHFSPAEARLLASLLPRSEIGENDGGYLLFSYDGFTHWMRTNGGPPNPWTISCVLLCEFHFADVLAPKGDDEKGTTILYRTSTGAAFLDAVTSPPSELKSKTAPSNFSSSGRAKARRSTRR
jgi:hypothetical protein